jgi:tRNA(Ile)-lysidine synthetase-like protein
MTPYQKALKGLEELKIDKSSVCALAYSGGPDSTFLLNLLYQAGYRNLYLLYVNYHDSPFVEEEERIVRQNAEKYQAKLIMCATSVKSGNFEAEARKIRYAFFQEQGKKLNFRYVFLAHHQDDLLLSYLMQKQKGIILDYYGIRPVSTFNSLILLRPLLLLTKEEIVSYLAEKKIPYYDDITNKNPARTRNRLRQDVLPSLDREETLKEIEEKNASIEKSLSSFAPYLSSLIPYDLYDSKEESLKLSFLYQYLRYKDPSLNLKSLPAMRNLAYMSLKNRFSTQETSLKNSLYLDKNSDSFYIRKGDKGDREYSYILPDMKEYDLEEIYINLSDLSFFPSIHQEDFPLTIRNVRRGDTFRTDIKTKDVLSFLAKNKVPLYLRKEYPVICSKNGDCLFSPFYKDLKEKKIPLRFKRFIV